MSIAIHNYAAVKYIVLITRRHEGWSDEAISFSTARISPRSMTRAHDEGL